MAYTVPDLLFWTDARIESMKENYAAGVEPGDEAREGRAGATPGAPYWQVLSSFDSVTKEYSTLFKTLAQRIMNLPEDSPSLLQSMTDQYKVIVNSLTVGSMQQLLYNDVWQMRITSVWYSTSAYTSLVDSVLNYERTYGVKKNSVVAFGTCYIDAGGEYYWEVRGAKAYLPAFTDVPYYSTIKRSYG